MLASSSVPNVVHTVGFYPQHCQHGTRCKFNPHYAILTTLLLRLGTNTNFTHKTSDSCENEFPKSYTPRVAC